MSSNGRKGVSVVERLSFPSDHFLYLNALFWVQESRSELFDGIADQTLSCRAMCHPEVLPVDTRYGIIRVSLVIGHVHVIPVSRLHLF